jgi:ABC-type glycerol-3-phosphate transport system permease component
MKKFANLYLALVFVILYIPIAYLIFYSFNQGGDMNGFTGFTLEHYSEMFADSRLMLILIQTFLKDKDKVLNAMELPYSNAKLEATNNLIKVIKRNAFGFRNFENFKKRILIALNSEKGWGEPFSAYLLKTKKR